MTSRPSTAAPILAVLAIVLPFVLYVGGYFWLAERRDLGPIGGAGCQLIIRVYSSEWQAKIFAPASRLEAILANRTVRIGVKG